ncbi:BTB POZ domain-containing protein [Rutstroemia sp. NJR-2017a WRK4]|nr:BTB POZ domain-containing protein [Rutstroemia sp. NJR-2017a WRK4]
MGQIPLIIDEAPVPMEKHIIDPDGDCFLLLQEKEKSESNNHQASVAEVQEPNDGDLIHEPVTKVAKRVELQVSAKHLMLASPVFKVMLREKDRFKEGEDLHNTGTVRIDLPDDEPLPFRILMNVIHCRSALVPKEVKPKTLYKLALLVDKYQMHDAVNLCSEIWIAHQDLDILTDTSEKLFVDGYLKKHLYWLCISWIFADNVLFETVTANLTRGIGEDLSKAIERSNLTILVPDSVIVAIEKRRVETIDCTLKILNEIITKYSTAVSNKTPICDGQGWIKSESDREELRACCDASIIGKILSGPASYLILQGAPQAPYAGYSVKKVLDPLFLDFSPAFYYSLCTKMKGSNSDESQSECASERLMVGFYSTLRDLRGDADHFNDTYLGFRINEFKPNTPRTSKKRKRGDTEEIA